MRVSRRREGPFGGLSKEALQLGEDLLGPSRNLRASHHAVTRSCQGTRLPWPWKPRCPPRAVSIASIIARRDQSIAV
jgi:hypothetical protein